MTRAACRRPDARRLSPSQEIMFHAAKRALNAGLTLDRVTQQMRAEMRAATRESAPAVRALLLADVKVVVALLEAQAKAVPS